MQKYLLAWELAGIAVIIVGGTVLHFVFAWSGRHRMVAPFAPINESVWEHLKMAYWPLVAFTGVELAALTPVPAGLLIAKAAAFAVMAALVVGMYYVSAAMLQRPRLAVRLIVDATIFVVAVAVGQLVSYLLLTRADIPGGVVGAGLLAVPAIVFVVTTFAPPRVELFRDQITGRFGM